jgi:hypothetical protein
LYKGDGADSVGPGNYNVPEKSRISGPAALWKKPTEQPKKFKIIQEQKLGKPPGPGSYKSFPDLEELKINQIRPSSFFVSNVPRDKE